MTNDFGSPASHWTNAINLPLALFFSASVAFAAFAMPADMFGNLIGATGLSSVLPAAQPPFGFTARVIVSAAAALVGFLGVLSLFSLVDKAPAPAVAPTRAAATFRPVEAPRLRRADTHPDAPARAPIFAERDLGEPEPNEAAAGPAPAPEPAPEPVEVLSPEAEAPAAAIEKPVERVAAPRKLPSFLDVEQPPEPQESEPAASAGEAESISGMFTRNSAASSDDSISSLMQRLEGGLDKKAPGGNSGLPGEVDDRLRLALGDLQKMAGRASGA
jgi:hypothetical protein